MISVAMTIGGAYLLGSVLFAVVISRLFRLPDPHTYGSNNPGATNVYRTGKKLAAVLTLIGDALKGWLPVFIAKMYAADFGWDERIICLVALAVFLGHLFPIFFKFAGGKGVATALGILVGIDWRLGFSLLAVWLIIVVATRKSSLAALIAAVFAPILSLLLLNSVYYHLTILLIALLLIWRHRSNIQKLISNREDSIDNKIDIKSR